MTAFPLHSPVLPMPSPAALRRLPAVAVVGLAWLSMAAMLAPAGRALGSAALWIADLAAAGAIAPADLPALIAGLCRAEAGVPPGWPARLAMWALMATAMMLPCAAPGWRRVGAARDWRGGYGFLGGHLAVWLGFAGLAAAVEAAAAVPAVAGVDFAAAAVAAVAAWQFSGTKARALARLRRAGRADPAAAAPGWRAGARDGLGFGRACLLANGPLMGLMLVAGAAGAAAMVGVGAAMVVERLAPARLGPRLVGAALFAVAAWSLAAAA